MFPDGRLLTLPRRPRFPAFFFSSLTSFSLVQTPDFYTALTAYLYSQYIHLRFKPGPACVTFPIRERQHPAGTGLVANI